MQRALAGGGAYEQEYRIVRPTGEIRSVFARGRAVADRAGTVLALHGVCQDITDRKAAEAEQARLAAEVRRANQLEAVAVAVAAKLGLVDRRGAD